MATVKMVAEDDATGRVAEVYDAIKNSLGIDFVPNRYKAMAVSPGFLEANWKKVEAVMSGPTKLDRLTKEVIAVSVSAVMGCEC